MAQVPVVTIVTENGPVEINASDFDARKHKLWAEKEKAAAAPVAEPPAPETKPAEPVKAAYAYTPRKRYLPPVEAKKEE